MMEARMIAEPKVSEHYFTSHHFTHFGIASRIPGDALWGIEERLAGE
jgi:hypothetical protein